MEMPFYRLEFTQFYKMIHYDNVVKEELNPVWLTAKEKIMEDEEIKMKTNPFYVSPFEPPDDAEKYIYVTKLVFAAPPEEDKPPEEDPIQLEYKKRLKKIEEWEIKRAEIIMKAYEE